MLYNLEFYLHASDTGCDHTVVQRDKLTIVSSKDDFDREGYSGPEHEALVITNNRYKENDKSSAADLSFQARSIRSGNGQALETGRRSLFLVTLCVIGKNEREPFLTQFDHATTFIESRGGFINSLLFQEQGRGEETIHLVNLARWKDRNSFISTFSSPAFREIVGKTFRWSSQIMVADVPALKSELIIFS